MNNILKFTQNAFKPPKNNFKKVLGENIEHQKQNELTNLLIATMYRSHALVIQFNMVWYQRDVELPLSASAAATISAAACATARPRSGKAWRAAGVPCTAFNTASSNSRYDVAAE